MVLDLAEGHKVQKVSTVSRVINPIFQVSAGQSSSCQRRILKVVNDERGIVDNFGQSTDKVDIFVLFKLLQNFPSINSSKHKPQSRPPPLATSIEQVESRIKQAPFDSLNVDLLVLHRLEKLRIYLLQVLFASNFARNDALEDLVFLQLV